MPIATPDKSIYGQATPLVIPAYSPGEAARYLQLPEATVRAWVAGQRYQTTRGARRFKPVLKAAATDPLRLSFQNLVEIHVLSAIRRRHRVSLNKVRRAVEFLAQRFHTQHPFADRQLITNGYDLFVQEMEKLINVSSAGQLAMRPLLDAYLERIERDARGVPMRLYPFTTGSSAEVRKAVVIDPRVQFGRPCIAGTGIPTTEIVERYKAGDGIAALAKDYGRSTADIEEALRYELPAA